MYIDLIEFIVLFFIAAMTIITITMFAVRHIELAKWGALIITTVGMFLAAFAFLPSALADEVRVVTVTDFDFETANVVLEDEDGYIWICPFGQNNWSIGDQYYLFLPEVGEPEIFE